MAMYQQSLSGAGKSGRDSWLQRAWFEIKEQATLANLIGLLGALLALFCLLAIHDSQYWNIRLPLYLIVVIWTLLRPRVALYLLPVAIPWGTLDTLTLGGLSLNSADILAGLLTVSWLLSFTLRPYKTADNSKIGPLDRDTSALPRYLALAMVVLLLTMLFSMTVTLSLRTSLKELTKWIEALVVLLLGVQYIRTRHQMWGMVVIMCLAAVPQAFLGYIQYFFNLGPTAFVRDASLRVYGTFGQPNPYAGYLNMTLTLVIALTLLGGNWKTRILAGATTLLLVGAFYLSQSKGAILGLAAAVFLIVTLGIPRIRPLIGAGVIAALVITAAYLGGLIPEHYLDPVLRILGITNISFTQPSAQDFATAERLAHWIAGIRMFVMHPFLGVGIGNYPTAYPQYYLTIFVNDLGHAHNYYINIAAEAGIFGLIALLLFLVATFTAGGRAFRAVSKKYWQLQGQIEKPHTGSTAREAQRNLRLLGILRNDRALAIGLLAALLSVCIHNLVDNLYVHGMTMLFALLLVLLLRIKGKEISNVAS